MMTDDYDVIIVGGGVIGAAIFHKLSEMGNQRILLIEKSRFGLGSTAWSGGLIRCYHSSEKLREMAVESHRYYQAFERHTETICPIEPCGFLYFTYPKDEAQVRDDIKSFSNGHWINKTKGAEDFPFIRWSDLAGAVFEPTAGYMNTLAVTKAWIRAGRRNNATAMEGICFDKLLCQRNRVIGIQANGKEFYAPQVVLCTGAWTEKVAKNTLLTLPENVRAKSIQLNAYQVDMDISKHPAYVDPVNGWYGRPGSLGQMYLGCAVPEWDINPDVTAALDPAYSNLCFLLAGQRFKWIAGAKNIGGLRRFDGYAHDESGLISESESTKGLFWATGFSGGGFKLAPAVASRVKNLLEKTSVSQTSTIHF
jgi:glycine/D-amino acid oxidase-like deaminating enzyme